MAPQSGRYHRQQLGLMDRATMARIPVRYYPSSPSCQLTTSPLASILPSSTPSLTRYPRHPHKRPPLLLSRTRLDVGLAPAPPLSPLPRRARPCRAHLLQASAPHHSWKWCGRLGTSCHSLVKAARWRTSGGQRTGRSSFSLNAPQAMGEDSCASQTCSGARQRRRAAMSS